MRSGFAAAIAATISPPVMEARRWLAEAPEVPGRPLINVSQAAPVAPPPEALRRTMAETVLNDDGAHLYGPVLGLPGLRAAVAARSAALYGGAVAPAQVAITAGCNMAFCATLAALAGPGDAVLLPVPWYFNHKMWCDMAGVAAVPLPCGLDMVPDPAAAAARIGPRTRAIVLVSPNNPTGVAYPPPVIAAFRDLARARGVALILDETYRDFHPADGPPHDLLADPGWDDTVVHLYSFSKAYRLTGHRVGAILAAPALLAQAEKFLDTVAICPGQIGQRAALWGMTHLDGWLAAERAEILARGDAVTAALAGLDGWRLLGSGAYFAYAAHPFDEPSDRLARRLVRDAGVLLLPGTMFRPADDPAGACEVRIAFANIDAEGIAALAERLAAASASR